MGKKPLVGQNGALDALPDLFANAETGEGRPFSSSPGTEEDFSFAWPGKAAARRLAAVPANVRFEPALEARAHLFIEGDNLAALKGLLPAYAGRIRLIYIDPPYNTGRGFVYADRFAAPRRGRSREGWAEDERARRHAAWLSMIFPRLLLARELLREDGLLCVSIDDNEVHHLRLLLDEIFGASCFKNCVITRRGAKNVQAQFESMDSLAVGHEYLLIYARSPHTRFRKLKIALSEPKGGGWNNHWRGTDRPRMRYELFGITPATGQWRWREERSRQAAANYARLLEELGATSDAIRQEAIDIWHQAETARSGQPVDLLRLSPRGKPEHYVPPADGKLASDLWTDIVPNGGAELRALLGTTVFDNPKPTALIRRILDFATDYRGGDLVLDFFAGSCSTAHAVLAANHADGGNRRFIMVQAPDPVPPASAARAAGFATLAEIGQARIRAVLARLASEAEGALWEQGAASGAMSVHRIIDAGS